MLCYASYVLFSCATSLCQLFLIPSPRSSILVFLVPFLRPLSASFLPFFSRALLTFLLPSPVSTFVSASINPFPRYLPCLPSFLFSFPPPFLFLYFLLLFSCPTLPCFLFPSCQLTFLPFTRLSIPFFLHILSPFLLPFVLFSFPSFTSYSPVVLISFMSAFIPFIHTLFLPCLPAFPSSFPHSFHTSLLPTFLGPSFLVLLNYLSCHL